MGDDLEILKVSISATKKEIKRAYCRKMIEAANAVDTEGNYRAQLVKEAYSNLMKGFGERGHPSQQCTQQELDEGVVCRCGALYVAESAQENIVECMSCSCHVEIV